MLLRRLSALIYPSAPGQSPTRYALDIRTFWFSHYLATGLRTSTGIMAVALAALWLLPQQQALALSAAFGAACLALVDQTRPLRSKARELAVSHTLNTLVSLWIGLLYAWPLLQNASVLLITFASAFLLLYGARALPVQFSMLMAMTLALERMSQSGHVLPMVTAFFTGGLVYGVYALLVSRWLQSDSKRQVLAECLFELALYIDTKGGFYERKVHIDAQYTALIRQQVVLAERQQAARDLVLQYDHPTDAQDSRLIQIHLGMLDVYEQVLTTHTDYQALHQHFGGSDVLLFLRDLVRKATLDMDAIALAVMLDRPSESPVTYTAEKRAIEFELHLLQNRVQTGDIPAEVLTLLRSTYYKIVDITQCIARLHAATRELPAALPDLNLGLFVSRPQLRWQQLRNNFSLRSPILRYAIRITLAMLCAVAIGAVVPYAAHAYWIMLTIAIIMKPSYSITRERRTKRLIGTAIGCVLAAVVLHLIHSTTALLLVLFISLTVSATFVQLRFMYTAVAATLTVMVLLHFGSSASTTGMLAERLMDTFIGVLLAGIFSHVFPSWERQSIPHLIRTLFDGARHYMAASHTLLLGNAAQDQAYRLARKHFLDQIAAVNAALLRMLDEPHQRQHDITPINRLLVRAYLMTSHIAALRMVLRRQPWLPDNAAFRQMVEHAMTQADAQIAHALHEWQQPPASTTAANNVDASPSTPPNTNASAAPHHQYMHTCCTDGIPITTPSDAWLHPLLNAAAMPDSTEHTRNVLRHRITALQKDAYQLVCDSHQVAQAGWTPI